MVLKRSLNKLVLPEAWEQALVEEAFRPLPVTWQHAVAVGRLPDLHSDPFDRLLLAQTTIEGLTLVTHDEAIMRYDVPLLKA
jgi:PIN domain nuclease of toxin-antitoxin system